eukprot:TRINITY_DN1152_c0_g2_i1.p1 TRINITY_DN1152_c0_g2~~TRINITY_DN1152_c0_g2_i1.p1  ORF type:complete len:443 (+),score=117.88 TRINITY_DN1152_c0_g2_i1:46-1329(+)
MNRSMLAAVVAAAAFSGAAGLATTNEKGVLVMDMKTHTRYENRQIIYQDKVGSDPMGGDIWPVAIYWVEIQVGTPARTFPVAIDTGSFTLDIPHVSCDTCILAPPNNVYDNTKSTTSKVIGCGLECTEVFGTCNKTQCAFSNTYETCDLSDPTAPCTIKGLWYNDQVTFGGATGSVGVNFGTITYQTSNFDQFKNIDGVMGLAGPDDSTNTFNQLVKGGKLPENVFAMCFVKGKTSNGTITFGGTDPRLYTSPIKYVPDTGGETFYSVEMKEITVAGASVPGTSSSKAILDSGTNILLLPTDMFKGVRTAFTTLCSKTNLPGVCNTDKSIFDGYCYDYTQTQLQMFPNMTIGLDLGVALEMQVGNYLLQGQKAGTVYCLGIRDTGANGLLIIGDSTMENYYMVMDRTNKQIGWSPVNRTSCGSIGNL